MLMHEIDTSLIEWLQAPQDVDIDESIKIKIARVLNDTNLNLVTLRDPLIQLGHVHLLCSASLWQDVASRVAARLPMSDIKVQCVAVVGAKFDAISKDETIYINVTSAESGHDVVVGLLSHEIVHCVANKIFNFKPKKPSISEFLRRMYIEGCCTQLQDPFATYLDKRDELNMRSCLKNIDTIRAELAKDVSSALNNATEFGVAYLWRYWMKNFGPGYGLAYATVAAQAVNTPLIELICRLRDSPQECYSRLLGSRCIAEKLIQREPTWVGGGDL